MMTAKGEPRPVTVLSPSGEPIACRDEAEAARVREWVRWYKLPHAFRDAARQKAVNGRANEFRRSLEEQRA